MGRDGFSAQDYLRLWDRLSANGIIITGNGDSDNHHAVKEGWTEGNNFCTYAGLYDTETPSEEAFLAAFQRGSAWLGNPVHMGEIQFHANGKPMGSIHIGKEAACRFDVHDVKCDGYVRCIINGDERCRWPLLNGQASGEITLTAQEKYNFARLELYREDGLLIAATNPIYLIENPEDVLISWKNRLSSNAQ